MKNPINLTQLTIASQINAQNVMGISDDGKMGMYEYLIKLMCESFSCQTVTIFTIDTLIVSIVRQTGAKPLFLFY